ARELLSKRGLAFRAWRRRLAGRHRLQPGAHLAPPQHVQAETTGDRDEPRQDGPLWIESLEVDERAHERVLREVFGVGSDQSPAEPQDRPLKAEHQLVE